MNIFRKWKLRKELETLAYVERTNASIISNLSEDDPEELDKAITFGELSYENGCRIGQILLELDAPRELYARLIRSQEMSHNALIHLKMKQMGLTSGLF